jgi:hypothetical protein
MLQLVLYGELHPLQSLDAVKAGPSAPDFRTQLIIEFLVILQ